MLTASVQGIAERPGLKAMILMPGPLIEAHASEENNCEACHSNFDKGSQSTLCLECHEKIASDQSMEKGFHGINTAAKTNACKSCHKDHKGREFASIPLDRDTFDHGQTNFSLEGAHRSVQCSACHQKNENYRVAATACLDCHEEDSPHKGAMGNECEACHSPQGWTMKSLFDHSATEFPLQGSHKDTPCSSCHGGEVYKFESLQCASCHALSDSHNGVFGTSCEDCHSAAGWAKTDFSHAVATGFKLRGAHQDLPCAACHASETEPATECVDCHGSIDSHAGRFGQGCDDCHNTRQWQMTLFNHARQTGWPLPRGHTDLTCLQCHRGGLDEEVDSSCSGCHRSDDVHASESMALCDTCHSSEQWSNPSRFDHELTAFPLEGLHAIASCQSCHRSHVFSEAKAQCSDCHAGEDAHSGAMGNTCGSCHTPNGWRLTVFDHGRDTNFTLSGSHESLSCESCHSQGGSGKRADCEDCHAADDRHHGNFGKQCGTCHGDSSWRDIQWPH